MSPSAALKRGAIAGIAMSFVGGIGMVEAFNTKVLISPILTMGYAVMYSLPLVIAWVATKREVLEGMEVEPNNFGDVHVRGTGRVGRRGYHLPLRPAHQQR